MKARGGKIPPRKAQADAVTAVLSPGVYAPSPEQLSLRSDLASGRAHLRFIKSDEAWYHSAITPHLDSWANGEWCVGVDSADGGTYGEWMLVFCDLDGPTVQHRVFEDSIGALLSIPGYWEAMHGARTRTDVEAALRRLGFSDKTEYTQR